MTQTIAIQLTREQQATLNNLRAVIKRQLRPTSSVEPQLVADILLTNSNMMREAGLAREQFDYLQQIRDRSPEGTILYAQLTSHMASMMDMIDELMPEAGEMHSQALAMFDTLPKDAVQAHAETHIAFGRHLINISKLQEATSHYQSALKLLDGEKGNIIAAVATGELGRAYVGRGMFVEAVPHFENALKAMPNIDAYADEKARVQADFATALIQLDKLDQAQAMLNDALATCNRLGLWSLRGQVRRELALVDQMQADKTQDADTLEKLLDKAQELLKQTVTDLLPISDTLGLAVAYHDLGRLEARRRNFDDAMYHVNLSVEMFTRLGNVRNLSVAEITLGQMILIKTGDVAASNEHLHKALSLASELGDTHTQLKAAESLVRVHKIQTKRAVSQPPTVRHQVIDQISFSRAKLSDGGMTEYAQQLDPLIAQLEAVEKSGDVPTA